jgi:hypothetical protein
VAHRNDFNLVKIGAVALLMLLIVAPLSLTRLIEARGATARIGSYPFIASVDTMKESKDAERNRLTYAQIAQDVRLAATLNPTHITVNTRMEYPAVMGQWVTAVRQAGKNVWFRLGSDNCSQTRSSYLAEMQKLIASNPGFFRSGDVFDGDAEAENSCYWTDNCGSSGTYACPDQFNTFVQNLTTYADRSFKQIGVSGVITWIHSTDPGTATSGLLNATTVAIDHNTVTVDAYPDGKITDPATAANAWLKELNELHGAWPAAQLVIGEAGYSLNINVADATQHAVLSAEYNAIKRAAYPWLVGWNYWVGAGGSSYGGYTNIFVGSTGNWRVRPGASDLAAFYGAQTGRTNLPATKPSAKPPAKPSATATPSAPFRAQPSPSPSPSPRRVEAGNSVPSPAPGAVRFGILMLVGGIVLLAAVALLGRRLR